MDWEKIFAALATVDGGAAMVEQVRAYTKRAAESEAELTSIRGQLDGVNLSEARAAAEFLSRAGGMRGIEEKLRTADGASSLQKSLDDLRMEHESKIGELNSRLSLERLRNTASEFFAESFRGSRDILDLAISRSQISLGDDGSLLVTADGGARLPLNGAGGEFLKKTYEYALKTPSGAGSSVSGGGSGQTPGARSVTKKEFDGMNTKQRLETQALIASGKAVLTD